MRKRQNRKGKEQELAESAEQVREKIRKRAYEFFELRGKENGRDLDDWVKAESQEKTNLLIGGSEIGGTTMCSPMLTVQGVPTGVALVQGSGFEISPPVHEKYEAESNPIHMNWVLVDDTKGNHRVQMLWVVEG